VGIALNSRGEVYVADTANRRICIFDNAGTPLYTWYVSGWTDFYTEPYLAIDEEDYVYVTDASKNKIKILSPKGELVAYWGGSGTTQGLFEMPKGITYSGGKLYVVDMLNSRIQVFTVQKIKDMIKKQAKDEGQS
jgi:DNA-binding beta-propeller fold protein YncE